MVVFRGCHVRGEAGHNRCEGREVFHSLTIIYCIKEGIVPEKFVGSCSCLGVHVELFNVMIQVVLDEVLNTVMVSEDSLDASDVDDPDRSPRSSSLYLSNSSGDRREGAEVCRVASSRLFDVEGLNGGISSHSKHVGEVVGGDRSVMDDAAQGTVSCGYPHKTIDIGATLGKMSRGRLIALSAEIIWAIDVAVG